MSTAELSGTNLSHNDRDAYSELRQQVRTQLSQHRQAFHWLCNNATHRINEALNVGEAAVSGHIERLKQRIIDEGLFDFNIGTLNDADRTYHWVVYIIDPEKLRATFAFQLYCDGQVTMSVTSNHGASYTVQGGEAFKMMLLDEAERGTVLPSVYFPSNESVNERIAALTEKRIREAIARVNLRTATIIAAIDTALLRAHGTLF